MRSSSSLLGEGFIMDRLRLDILIKIFRRIFNKNPCSPCVPWIKNPLSMLKSKYFDHYF